MIRKTRYSFLCLLMILIVILLSGCLESGESDRLLPSEGSLGDESVPDDFFVKGQEIGNFQSWDLILADFNSDGYLDLFVASLDDDPKIWMNDGTGVFSPGDQQIPACARAVAGDVNGDGLVDIIIAEWHPNKLPWSNLLSIWLNSGSGLFSPGDRLDVNEGSQSLLLADLNADQTLDLFVLGTGQNEVWINNGQGKFDYLVQDLPTGLDAAAGIGDLDGDGDQDVLVGGWEGPPAVWMNDGSGYFSRSEISITDEDLHIHGLALGDLDGDGDLDAFVTLANRDPHQIWINDGGGGFINSQELSASLGHAVALGDLDGDGDLDAVTGHGYQGSGHVRLWLNDGEATFTDSSLFLGEYFTGAVVLGDLDQDQDLDIISAQSAWGEDIGPPDLVWINTDHD